MKKTDLEKNLIIKKPKIHKSVFIAAGAKIIGNVIIKENSSIWYNTVVRGDINKILIGKKTNIQDNSVLHVENDTGIIIEDYVTVGHNSILHGCKISQGVLVGMGAIIMNEASIGKGSIIGAGSLIKEKMIIPDYSVVVGIPGKIIKQNKPDILKKNIAWATKYVKLSNLHRENDN